MHPLCDLIASAIHNAARLRDQATRLVTPQGRASEYLADSLRITRWHLECALHWLAPALELMGEDSTPVLRLRLAIDHVDLESIVEGILAEWPAWQEYRLALELLAVRSAVSAEATLPVEPDSTVAVSAQPEPTTSTASAVEPLKPVEREILDALRASPLPGKAVALTVGRSYGHCRSVLSQMRSRGLLANDEDGYHLTTDARRMLDACSTDVRSDI